MVAVGLRRRIWAAAGVWPPPEGRMSLPGGGGGWGGWRLAATVGEKKP